MPLGFPAEAFDSGLRYEARAGDVFVCTYPKCGTTWMQYIVYLLCHDARPLAPEASLGDAFPHLEEVGREAVEALPPPRLIKTHLPRALTPFSAAARYIHVARNPFDCAVSFFHHTRGFPQHYDFADGTFEDFFECFVRGEVDFGDYFEHLVSWYELEGAANVLFLTYERMKSDARAAIIDVARFLGSPACETAAVPAKLERVVEASSFSSMRRDQRRWSSERPAGMPEFVRKGAVGDWSDLFAPDHARRLAERFAAATAGSPAAGLWPDLIAAARGR
jgi:hypothetical protein